MDWSFLRATASDEVLASIEAVLTNMTALGARVVEVTFPGIEPVLRGWATQCAVEAALAHQTTYPSRRREYGERLAALLDRGAGCSGIELAQALQSRRDFNGRMALLFEQIDLFVVPGLPVAGPTLDYMSSLGEDPAAILAIGPFTAPFDVCGYPTITLPCGASTNGIPIGFQFVAKPFCESLLCRAAHAYQQITDWHQRRPPLPHAA